MTDPLEITFEVGCLSDHAFDVWTTRIATWWPADHSVSGNPDTVVLEPRLGGRLYERSPDGTEHDWGEITRWEPPQRFAYRWHLGRDRQTATNVEIRFEELGPTTTRVVIEHHGSAWTRRTGEIATASAGKHSCRITAQRSRKEPCKWQQEQRMTPGS